MKKRLIAMLLVVVLSVSLLATTVSASAAFTHSSAWDLIQKANHNKHGICADLTCHYCHPCKDDHCGICHPICWDDDWCGKCHSYSCSHIKSLTFDTNGGNAMPKVYAYKGTTISLAGYTPTRLGYDFGGWYSDKSLNTRVYSVTLDTNETVYAKWEPTIYTALIPFLDIPVNSYYYNATCWANQCGVAPSAQYFKPDAACTRGDMITFLWRAAGSPQSKLTYMPFTDVSEKAACYEAVQWALEMGITKGTNNLKFRPNETVNRAEVITFLYRYSKDTTTAANPYTDVAEGDWFYDAVRWADSWGITKGTNNLMFRPYDECTRAQVLTFLHRYFG